MNCLNQTLRRARPLLGTTVEITLQGNTAAAFLQNCISAGFEAIADIDRLMSFHRPDSDLTRLNQAPAWTWIRVDPRTLTVLKAANALYRASSGAFDIRCGAALTLKGRLPKISKAHIPVEICGRRVQKTGAWILDLGGIAKGYAVDSAVRAMQQRTRDLAVSGTVNAGGDLRTWGHAIPVITRFAGETQPWARSFTVQKTALATSTPTFHVHMPEQTAVAGSQTALAFATKCLIADALTKIALLAPDAIAENCFKQHNARGLIFHADGTLSKVIAA